MGSGIEQETVEWPGLLTCAADREDHGTTGAYTAWPALAAEALCYIEGNCSCVDISSLVCCVCDSSLASITGPPSHACHLHYCSDSRGFCKAGPHSRSWGVMHPTHCKEPSDKQTPCPNKSLLRSSRTTMNLRSSPRTAGMYEQRGMLLTEWNPPGCRHSASYPARRGINLCHDCASALDIPHHNADTSTWQSVLSWMPWCADSLHLLQDRRCCRFSLWHGLSSVVSNSRAC